MREKKKEMIPSLRSCNQRATLRGLFSFLTHHSLFLSMGAENMEENMRKLSISMSAEEELAPTYKKDTTHPYSVYTYHLSLAMHLDG